MANCPSCAAPLDDEGVCTSCGALTRGFFRGLDLGPPQIAAAVARGLDFYRLLGVDPQASVHAVARRYRQLRVLFPDDPSGLAPEPARRLELLEVAGRALTDPQLRQVYDELRAGRDLQLTTTAVRCTGCTAPLSDEADHCRFCGTPRPTQPMPPAAPLTDGPPAAEPVDYYAVLGLNPTHLIAPPSPVWGTIGSRPDLRSAGLRMGSSATPAGPPTAEEVDTASYSRQREALLGGGISPERREVRLDELELARRILRDERLRSRYDTLWRAFQRGTLNAGHLEGLNALQEEARAASTAERGEQPAAGDAEALLRQGLGYLDAGLPREAADVLRRAVAAAPQLGAAQAALARATLASADPLDLGAHALRQALAAVEAAAALGAPLANGSALAALCRGLLARDQGDQRGAETQLQAAVREDSTVGAAWRALAALALGRGAYEEALAHCRRALAVDRSDERALLMAAGACLRSRRRDEARQIADQIATMRGDGWSAEVVLREIGP
jgi:tetratricopeptide (TPR) repeat protein